MIWRVFCCALSAISLFGQSESDLKRNFEGKTVRVKIDMPATKEGIDLHFGQNPAIDMKSYTARVRTRDVSLRAGDSVVVSVVKVKEKNIEFQLGGGGYGVWGDDTGTVPVPVVAKSNRERDLERDVRNESDPRRRDRLGRELSLLVASRQREEARLRAEAMRLREIKRQEVHDMAVRAGSRFNLWFPKGYLKEWVPTSDEVMSLLSDYVDFGQAAPRRPERQTSTSVRPPPEAPDARSVPSMGINGIRRGMSADELHRALGNPTQAKDGPPGDVATRIETFETRENTLTVTLVEGIVVKYAVNSR